MNAAKRNGSSTKVEEDSILYECQIEVASSLIKPVTLIAPSRIWTLTVVFHIERRNKLLKSTVLSLVSPSIATYHAILNVSIPT